jgi:hypothetical protein
MITHHISMSSEQWVHSYSALTEKIRQLVRDALEARRMGGLGISDARSHSLYVSTLQMARRYGTAVRALRASRATL